MAAAISAFILLALCGHAWSVCPWSLAIWDIIKNSNCWDGQNQDIAFVHPALCYPNCSPSVFPCFCSVQLNSTQPTCRQELPEACTNLVWPNGEYKRTKTQGDMLRK